MVIEDDQSIQGIVEVALSEGGFEPAIAASGEEAVTLLKGRSDHYRALVTDIGLRGESPLNPTDGLCFAPWAAVLLVCEALLADFIA